MSKFIDYNELYKILHEKIEATHDELMVYAHWGQNYIENSLESFDVEKCDYNHILIPFLSDLPGLNGNYECPLKNFDPRLCFYHIKNINRFDPPRPSRLVYIRDLPKRNWDKHLNSEKDIYSDFLVLDRAAESGHLRFYDKETYEFTFHERSKSNNPSMDKLWIHTDKGQKYVTKPFNFFLLQDIVNIERIFFDRPRNDCLLELGFNPKDYE